MYLLITYDVNTKDNAGSRRLRNIAKCCLKYGLRVQNSVFECSVTESQFLIIKETLLSIMDHEKDSIRFYRLGKNYESKVTHYGIKASVDIESNIII